MLDRVADPTDVLRILRERMRTGSRDDGHRVVLSVEGGGNRGSISGAMAGALHDEGVVPAFDAVYGSSAGALTGAWLLSSDPHRGLRAWADPRSYAAYTRASNLLRRRPVVDLAGLIIEFYDGKLGLDAERVLANPVEFHPLATDADTGRTTDLHPVVRTKATLHGAMRASSALPILAGKPVPLAGHRYLDAGITEPVPYATPIADGATHMVMLRSRRLGLASSDGLVRRPTAAWLARYSPATRDAFLTRRERALELDARLANGSADLPVLIVEPTPDTPHVSRLESDATVITTAMAAGRQAMQAILATTVT
jgi:predicted patatin/cPLA2 family phospholipase